MADNKLARTGLMIEACAYKAKYRKEGPKVRLRPGDLGVHKKNRGGAYPAGLRVKELLVDIAGHGILQEEADHNCSAVEEKPLAEILKDGSASFQSSLDYNIQECAKDELLRGLYDEPLNVVHHSLLSHNHLMTICRAFLRKQLWRLEDNTQKNIKFCDADGRLSLSSFTATPLGEQLGLIIKEGFLCQVLSWKMDVQEPNAAEIISTAENEVNSVAMRTTEIQAIKVLRGEIITQMNKDVGQQVCFQTVRNCVEMRLGPAAADPDLQELFMFLISNGVGTNTYIDDFLEWAQVAVNPKKRQLRFVAFTPINKMANAPASRIAVAKRAYRGKATWGFCPSPENIWGTFTMEQITPLEELLRFCHVQCRELLKKLSDANRVFLLGSIDIAAAEAFFLVMTKGTKKDVNTTRECLLKATQTLVSQLTLTGESSILHEIDGKPKWIVFSGGTQDDVPAVAEPKSEAPSASTGSQVITFDEANGQALNQSKPEDTLSTAKKDLSTAKKDRPVLEQVVPWKAWQNVYALPVCDVQGAKASAVAVLHTLLAQCDASNVPVEVCERQGRIYVRATTRLEPGQLMMPPSVANTCSLAVAVGTDPSIWGAKSTLLYVREKKTPRTFLSESHTPNASDEKQGEQKEGEKRDKKKRKVEEKKDTAEDEVPEVPEFEELPRISFQIMPEWKMPAMRPGIEKGTDTSDTVEGNTVCPPTNSRVRKVERSIDDYKWAEPGCQSQSKTGCSTNAAIWPSWGVRRLTTQALKLQQDLTPATCRKAQFNCSVQYVKMTNVCVGVMNGKAVNSTRVVEVPFLTNHVAVEEGEELLLEKPPEQPQPKKTPLMKRTVEKKVKK